MKLAGSIGGHEEVGQLTVEVDEERLFVSTNGDSTSPLEVVIHVCQIFLLPFREELGGDFGDGENSCAATEGTTILNEIDEVLAVLVLCLDSGADGLGVVKDAIVAGEGVALVQRDRNAGLDLHWSCRGKDSQRCGSEQGGLAEHGSTLGDALRGTAGTLSRDDLVRNRTSVVSFLYLGACGSDCLRSSL